MILRIGIDAVEIERIKEHVHDERFLTRVLTQIERERPVTPAYLAGRFAAKEAAKKCLPAISSWHDIEVLNEQDGTPVPVLKNGLLPSETVLHVSISHERTLAVAVAILESRAGPTRPGS